MDLCMLHGLHVIGAAAPSLVSACRIILDAQGPHWGATVGVVPVLVAQGSGPSLLQPLAV